MKEQTNNFNLEELNRTFIKEFIEFRKKNNLSQELFSEFANVSREKIARIEAGTHSPSIQSMLKILGPIGYTLKIEKIHTEKNEF